MTGLSGAGRSVAAGSLEDLGWFVIDNLPAELVPKVGELASSASGDFERVALIMKGHEEPVDQIRALRLHADAVTVVFLEASTDVLVNRYEATRRRHPMAEGRSLVEAIEHERRYLEPTRQLADVAIDTSALNPHQLRERLGNLFDDRDAQDSMRIVLSSFGFKHGLPLDADVVWDCRFLPNPHWEPDLRPLSGMDPEIQTYVLDREVTAEFIDQLTGILDTLLPAYDSEGKSHLSIAFGCTGGRHRSVAVAEEVARRLSDKGWRPRISHRDVHRESPSTTSQS
ncbi:MAG: RNase adapter RapZ [Actinomycetota bacterium]